jgi:ASC-1-like (ASCH) protein
MKYIEHVSEPWFSLILLGLKTVEGRLNKGRFSEMKEGDIIQWINDDFNHREFITVITKVCHYSSFESYLTKEKIKHCLPSIDNVKDGVDVYYKYYTPEKEKQFGIAAIHLKTLTTKQDFINVCKHLKLHYSNKSIESLKTLIIQN